MPAVLVGEGAQELGAAEAPRQVIDTVLAFAGIVCEEKNNVRDGMTSTNIGAILVYRQGRHWIARY